MLRVCRVVDELHPTGWRWNSGGALLAVGLHPMGGNSPSHTMAVMKLLLKTKLFTGGTIMLLAMTSAWAADTERTDQTQSVSYDNIDLYRANELSLEGFGSGSIGKYTIDHLSGKRIRDNTKLGAGVGISYFITRNLGINAEMYSQNTSGVFIDSASINAVFRMPLGQSGVAPYAFAGGGRQFELSRVWFAQGGLGLEYRFCPHVGVFVDARAVFPNETRYYGVGRLGLRVAF
jgi:hypothetical protein